MRVAGVSRLAHEVEAVQRVVVVELRGQAVAGDGVVQEGHLREVGKLQIRFTTVLLGISRKREG